MLEAQLKEVPFFSSLSKKELGTVAREVDEIDVAPGKELAREGEFGHEFFVIVDGSAEVLRGGAKIAELGPGDFFGEMALLEEERRVATVKAASPMHLLVMTRPSFRSLDSSMPQVHATIAAAIKARRAPAESATSG
jgi:CRP/FNR family cyclic AMP-dependent transcriptional regulator